MYRGRNARQLAILLRISRDLDICGDVTATVDNPSELLAWANSLHEPVIQAWRAQDSGFRYVQVTADHAGAPIRGRVAAVLVCEQHQEFWDCLGLADLERGRSSPLAVADLARAWEAMPVFAPGTESPPQPPVGRE
jgi:hypothetical protein